ncbi:RecB family exonuclease [Actinomycetospora lemnae]|uniref:PD-(D/E)XK nuclease family protein n=1 Tax=Actinomycetospora lemnae TaxID=3019891 RepID=A0ABT5SQK4_9PSEU|nr:PD-(D/E)XK nuclease family protein [Actinomycetospora sp. DW7H6]MDD7965123.1 PD-(D/E)XK nuclease family protein [Actinomycetospora sp. DW7H6]
MSMQLGLDGMPARLVRVTPSRLATWQDCRRRYRLTYLDRPAPPRGGPRAASTLGAVVHNALHAVFGERPARRSAARAALEVDRHWSSEGFRDDAQAAEYRERARTWVGDYVERHGVVDAPEPVGEVVGLERWLSAPVGAMVAEGRADRLDDRDGEVVVVDYKTGRRVPDAADAAGSPALALYVLAARRTLRRPCRRVELHHLPSGTIAAADHDEASLAAHRERAEAGATALGAAADVLEEDPRRAEELFPPLPGPRCGACEVRRHCPEGRAAAPAEPAWSGLAP